MSRMRPAAIKLQRLDLAVFPSETCVTDKPDKRVRPWGCVRNQPPAPSEMKAQAGVLAAGAWNIFALRT